MAHDAAKLRELLERVSAASGTDRKIDVAISRHFGTLGHAAGMSDEGLVGPFSSARRYTSSIDAAVRLLRQTLPGCTCKLVCEDERSVCIIRTTSSSPEVMPEAVVSAATAPLAILSALLRALISQAEGEAKHGEGIPPDVRKLVIAARNVAFDDAPSPEAQKALDDASEAFAARVPWEDAT